MGRPQALTTVGDRDLKRAAALCRQNRDAGPRRRPCRAFPNVCPGL